MNKEIFEKSLAVESHHLDALDHVNNVVWLQWVQDMAEAHWVARSTPQINSQYYWVVLNHYIEYKRPAALGDLLLGRTFIAKNDGVRSERHVQFLKEGKLCVEARTNWCLLDKTTNRPKRIPQEIIDLFSQ